MTYNKPNLFELHDDVINIFFHFFLDFETLRSLISQ